MATTTTNFGWDIPQSTDLVKNGATAIAELGQDIDTSMVGLKGGTTGQVLSKTSNTDMAFTWVAADDTNAIQNAIVDAKGDLIAATANDTPARLAVGSDYGWLKADSSASTGLAWDTTGFTSFTPTITAASGSFTSVSATGAYKRIGKLCFVQTKISITTNGTAAAAVYSTLPFTAYTGRVYIGGYREEAATGVFGQISIETNTATWRRTDNTYPGNNGWVLGGSFFYEVA